MADASNFGRANKTAEKNPEQSAETIHLAMGARRGIIFSKSFVAASHTCP